MVKKHHKKQDKNTRCGTIGADDDMLLSLVLLLTTLFLLLSGCNRGEQTQGDSL